MPDTPGKISQRKGLILQYLAFRYMTQVATKQSFGVLVRDHDIWDHSHQNKYSYYIYILYDRLHSFILY